MAEDHHQRAPLEPLLEAELRRALLMLAEAQPRDPYGALAEQYVCARTRVEGHSLVRRGAASSS